MAVHTHFMYFCMNELMACKKTLDAPLGIDSFAKEKLGAHFP